MKEFIKFMLPSETRRQIKFLTGSQTKTLLKKIQCTHRRTLDRRLKKICNEYAQDHLGKRRYAEWLYIYCMISGTFKEGWVPDDYYGEIVVPKAKGAYGDISELNALQSVLIKGGHLPDLVYCVNGIFFDTKYRSINNINDYLASVKQAEKVVFKKDKSMQGKGVTVLRLPIKKNDMDGFGDGVFQSYIRQHDFFDELHRSAVGTLRMTTVTENDGSAALRAAYLRLGVAKETHVRAASVIRIPVCKTTGRLFDEGYTVNWERIAAHPDTGAPFEGKTIPNFDACIELALELQAKVPFTRCVGWDMTLDKEGRPLVMEWNGAHNDIKFSEATTGPCFTGLGWENLWKT